MRAALAAVVAGLLLTGCTVQLAAEGRADAGGLPGDGRTVALLLPESTTPRYEGTDRPEFERAVAQLCPGCRVVAVNAGQDAARQQQQAEAALADGAGVIVLGAVDAAVARGIVTTAAARGVEVVAYDRLVADAPLAAYVSYDAVEVGRLQARALVSAVRTDDDDADGVLLVHGAPTDPNAVALKRGAHEVLGEAGVRVLAEYDTPGWSPAAAQAWVEGQLARHRGRVVGVYAANDGTAGGAVSAMRSSGVRPVLPVTGQDAELAAVQRVISGDQLMTVHKSIADQARTAAGLAVELLHGREPEADPVAGVPTVLVTPVAVTREDVGDVLVEGGVYTVEEICTAPYASACRELGLLGDDG